MQYRLRTILLFVLVASVALAAMRSASSAWASAIVTATLLALLVSIALAIERRPFWIGFAVCGAGYFAIVMTQFPPLVVNHLATSQVVTLLAEQFQPRPVFGSQNPASPQQANLALRNWSTRDENFRTIGESIWTLIIGALGGMLIRFVARRRESAARS